MPQINFRSLENTFHAPAMFRSVCFVMLSLFLLFFYFLSVHIMGIYGFMVFFPVLWIASVLGTEFFSVFFLVALFLQNILISSLTTTDDPNNAFLFSTSLGTSFFITCLFAVYSFAAWLGFRQNLPHENTILLRWSIAFSLVVVIYSGLGFTSTDFKSILSYLREYSGAIMFLCIGIAAGYKVPSCHLVNAIRVIATIIVAWGICELFFTREVMEIFNILHYIHMKFLGSQSVVESVDELAAPQSYLNFSGQFGLSLKLPRLLGPNLHAISYAYELAFCGLVCFMYRYRIQAVACFAILLLAASKGAIIEALMSLLFYFFYCAFSRPRLLLFFVAIFVSAYIAAVTYYGLASDDFHILGLIGSIHGFFSDPLGRGVGVGGNMSTQGLTQATNTAFERFQHQGSADFALESGFGVLLYQIGIGILVFLGFYLYLFKSVWSIVTWPDVDKRLIILPLALVFVMMNSVFQEEAFSPASIGLWMFFSGLFLAEKWKERSTTSIASSLQDAHMI